ncbi:MAG: S-layer homology domain-containing protein, partial [Oscillospiraceae bacterium]|nr:S-layer homology domain-containing protein [Oscillospiraceae bacterium]
KNAFTNQGYDFDCWVLYREEDGKYYTNNGWQSYEDMLTSGYLLATFEENSTWELDGLWTAGCENAREFSFVAIWKEAGSEPEVEPVTNPFTDVKPTDYFYDPVLWAVDEGVTSGLTPTTFGPKSTCTRAQVVTFLWRAMGEPAPSSYANPFTDVKPGDYFYEAVLWAVEQGITNGLSATSFGASQPCTRAQVATFLWRTMGKPAPSDGYCPFGDVAANAYYYQAVLWAVENGVTSGLSPSSFGPNAECSRAQIVTFLYRAIEE